METLEIINVILGAAVVVTIVVMFWRLTMNNVK